MQVRNIWCGFVYKFDNKKYDFDIVVLFVDFALRESVDFTGVLLNWWVVNRLVLMCYFLIKYVIFGGVRENALFIRVWGDFRVEYWWFLMVLKVMKCLIFQGFVEVDIEVVFWGKMSRKRWFYKGFVDWTDMPSLASSCLL